MKILGLTLLSTVVIPFISYYIYTSLYSPNSDTCDMNQAKNRNFNNFYGIAEMKNHFSTSIADECNCNVTFDAVLPQTVLKSDNSASSFMILARYGTGKTLLRCEYFRTLRQQNYFKILILNKQLSEYLERFVSETSTNGKDCENENCLSGWTKNEFAQLILSLLVTQFVDTFQKRPFDLPEISTDEKIGLITIICYYYNEQGVHKLEKFINAFLRKTNNSMYTSDNANAQIAEQNKYVDKPLLIQFKNDLKKFNVLRKDSEKLELLLAVIEGEGFQHQSAKKTMSDNVFNDLTHFTLFMKNHMKKPVVFIIDGIDENRYFFRQNVVNKRSLELFCRSSISQEILSLVMAHNFYLSLFYPEIEGINIQDAIVRNDKFPVYTINWDTRSLINYADYLLQEMNKNASTTHCRSFVDFKTLVNYPEPQIADMIHEIQTPRALHYFMIELIREMNKCANEVQKPFIATYENVKMALKKSNEYVYKRHSVN